MTDDELGALEALTAAATPGPWVAEPDPHYAHLGGNGYLVRVGPLWALDGGAALDMKVGDPDAAFTCAARTAVPALLAEVKRLRDELEEERWLRREDKMGSGEHWVPPGRVVS